MQSSQLRAHGLAALGRDLVLLFASLALVAERDEPAALGQRRERAVERACGEPHAPAAQALDVLHDAVAVQRRIQRKQNVKDRFGQRRRSHVYPSFFGPRYNGIRYIVYR